MCDERVGVIHACVTISSAVCWSTRSGIWIGQLHEMDLVCRCHVPCAMCHVSCVICDRYKMGVVRKRIAM